MAISGGDGSIILSTKVDTSGIKQGTKEALKFAELSTNEQRRLAQSLSGVYRKQGLSQSEAQKKAWADLKANTVEAKNLTAAMKGAEIQTKAFGSTSQSSGRKATTAISKISSSLKKLLTYFIGIQTVFAAIRFSGEAAEFATQTEASVQRLIDIYGEASESVGNFIDENAHALGMSRSAASQFSSVYGNLFSVWADQKENAELTTQYLNATAVVASKTGRTMADVQERIRSGLLGNTEAVEDLGIFVNVKTIEITDAFKRIADGRSWEQLTAYEQSQVRTLAILEQATKKYGTEVADTTALTKARYNAAFEDFKNTWGKIVNIVLVPVLKVATQILNVLTTGLTTIAKLSGKTIDDSQIQQANSIQQSVENQDALTESVKETAKEQQKLLAGFDEITKLSETEKESTAGVVANQTPTTTGTPLTVDNTEAQKATTEISSTLATIMGIAGVALVAIGLLLIATNHIAWGIGFIIAGAAALGVTIATLKSDKIGQDVKDKITAGLVIAGLVAVVLGILACFAQHWGLGISLIVLGATTIVGSIALNWNGVKQKLQGTLGKALAIVGAVAIVIGVLLCFAQKWAIGIGLIAAGAATLGVSIAANWDSIKQKLKGSLGTAIAIIGIVSIVIGILLCFAQQWVLGIGFIVTGAIEVATTVAVNWDSIKEKLKNPLNTALALIGIVAIVIGIFLCVSQMWGLGIGLIATGATSLVSAVALDWNTIKTKISNFFKDNTGLIIGVSTALLVIGIILCMTGGALPMGIGLIIAGSVGLATEAVLNFNTIKNKISEFFKNNAGLIVGVSTALLVIGIILCLTGGALPMGIGLIIAGSVGLATEAVLNWDTIKTKVSSAFDAVSAWIKTWGLLVLGIILVVSGVGLPLGLALIKKAGYNLTQAQSPLWNTITTKIQEAWQNVKNFWNTHIAKYFTAQWWSDLAKQMGNGLITGFENAVNSIITLFENMINWVVAGLNSISVQIPDWVPNYGGGKFGVNLPYVKLGRVSIPRLAQGAVIPGGREFLAVLGDQPKGQTNIETPLQTMIDAFNIALNQRDSGNQTIVLTVDGDVLFRTVVNKNRDYVNAMGVNPLGV